MDQNPQESTTSAAPPSTPPASSYPTPTGAGMVSQDDKSQAMLMWILALLFGWVVPLIFYLIKKDRPFVYRHSAMALALTIVTFIGYMISIPLLAVLIGLLTLPVVGIFHLVVCIMGAMAANKGDEYDPPIVSGLAKSMFKI